MPKKKRIITVLCILVLAAVIVVSGWLRLTGPRYDYAYVDPQQLVAAFQQTAEFQRLRQTTENEYSRYVEQWQATTEEELAALKREKTQQQKGKSPAEQRRIEEEFGTELRNLYATKQTELEAKQASLNGQLEKAVQERLTQLTAQVARAEGIPHVLSGQVVYFGGLDLTERVLTNLKNSGEQEHE